MSDDRYEIRGKIGQGGVGAVYRAYDRNLNREVAIKRVLTEEGFDPKNNEDGATRALLQEATALCSVQHPHIVTVYDAGVDEDGPYVVMELLSGRTLDEMIERGTMTWGDFRETAVQSLEALIAAQELDLVHRDIKPSNVMVTWLPSGKFQVKLVDFGLAKFSAAPSLQTIDHGDAVFGSIHFMAPEQFERVPLDKRTDMYSLGCVLFFCLAGNYPFDGETAPLVMAAHLQNTFTPLKSYRPDLPDWLCQWVEWFIARTPDDRPADAREALERFLAFERPLQADTAPVHVQAMAASAVVKSHSIKASLGGGAPSRMTGPIPLHVTPAAPVDFSAAQVPQPVVGEGMKEPFAPTKVFSSSSTVVSPLSDPPRASVPASPEPSIPIDISPPEGSTPSVHTGMQRLHVTGPVPFQTAPTPVSPQVGKGNLVSGKRKASSKTAQSHQTGVHSTATKVTLITFLALGVIIAGIVFVATSSSNKETKNIQRLLERGASPTTSEIPMTGEELDGLLSFASRIGFSDKKLAVYKTLYLASATDGTVIDDRIVRYATEEAMNDEVRIKLFQVVGRRGNDSAISKLVDFASDGEEDATAVAALEAASGKLRLRDLSKLFDLISNSESDEIRASAERALKSHIGGQQRGLAPTREMLVEYEKASNNSVKQAYLRLLGSSGDERAVDALKSALESDDENLKAAAYTAFGNWRDGGLFDEHVDAMSAEVSSYARRQAFDSVLTLLTGGAEIDSVQKAEMWAVLGDRLQGPEEKKKFITKLAEKPTQWGLELVKPFYKDSEDDVSFLAERAIESMKKRLK